MYIYIKIELSSTIIKLSIFHLTNRDVSKMVRKAIITVRLVEESVEKTEKEIEKEIARSYRSFPPKFHTKKKLKMCR